MDQRYVKGAKVAGPAYMTGTPAHSVNPPALKKRALSLFFRVGCDRQLLLYLYDDSARHLQGMPPRQSGRAGLGLVGRHGLLYQAQKVTELRSAFGDGLIVTGNPKNIPGQTAPIQLLPLLQAGNVQPYTLIVEGEYDGGTQRALAALQLDNVHDRHGNAIAIKALQPDLIQVLPSLASHLGDDPGIVQSFREEVCPDGSLRAIDEADPRWRLRVIDVKLSSEPGANYFAETVFYSMTLAAWLKDHDLGERYAVVATPAVLPGSLEDSTLTLEMAEAARQGARLSPAQAAIALENDLEIAPVEAFAPRILQLVREVIPRLLVTPWEQVDFHVDYRCAGCEFLGDPHIMSEGALTQHPLHCWPQAERVEHLSRVFGLSRGASSVLQQGEVDKTSRLAEGGAESPVFSGHHGLKARRTIYPARATSLHQLVAGVIPDSGGDALMPRWPNLHINVFIDYDPATAYSITFGCRAFWREPLPFGSPNEAQSRRWGKRQGDTEIFLVDKPTLIAERREFLRFLEHLREILRWVTEQDVADAAAGRRDKQTTRSTYQIYLWDEAQRRHFVRLVSRHLGAILNDPQLRHLAWIFPPPELLADAETASRRTPYTLVFDVVENTITVPTPHHYTLLDVTRGLTTPPLIPPSIHPLYRDTLSNLTPPERIHEYWTRRAGWRETEERLVETTAKKLAAVGMVVSELERRLGSVLSRLAAPGLPKVPRRAQGLAPEPYLWLEFAKLNIAVQGLEVSRTRAMPIHEREARFKSARLLRRLTGSEALTAWEAIDRSTGGLPPVDSLLIYKLSPESRDFNARPGDFTYALAPGRRAGFLDEHPYALTQNTPIRADFLAKSVDEAGLTAVSITGIERTSGLIALLPDPRNSKFTELAQFLPGLDFDRDVVLDPTHRDFLSRKIDLTLRGIGNPACAEVSPLVARALGLPANLPAGNDPISPPAEVLWQAGLLHDRVTERDVPLAHRQLAEWLHGRERLLMSDQWSAFDQALGRQLTLIWGPPGTGKSHTLRAIVLGAVLEARASGRPLRVLLSANTYTAVDNILLKLQEDLRQLLGGEVGSPKSYTLVRLEKAGRVTEHDFDETYRDIDSIDTGTADAIKDLRSRLDHPAEVLIVGAVTHQVHNLAVAGIKKPQPAVTQRDWFDLLIIDEASQMDVASATLVVSKRATNGTCIFAGDDLQLPPIQAADPPQDLEHVVGSVYNYLRHLRRVPYNALSVSFRSNSTLIDFTRSAGYDPTLRAHSPNLRLSLDPIPEQPPTDWDESLPWHSDYSRILDPQHPAICLLYNDRQSAQSNATEAGHIAALAALLRTRMHSGLVDELDATGAVIQREEKQYEAHEFWERGVGIVVPHRAQMSLVASRLIAAFPDDPPGKIRAAVDTVERFQGQERDVIIAGFGIGDPDVVQAEEEFLFSLRRFNVMASRARAKLIVLVSKTVVEHLSDDADVLQESLLLKRYAEQFCESAEAAADAPWELRWR